MFDKNGSGLKSSKTVVQVSAMFLVFRRIFFSRKEKHLVDMSSVSPSRNLKKKALFIYNWQGYKRSTNWDMLHWIFEKHYGTCYKNCPVIEGWESVPGCVLEPSSEIKKQSTESVSRGCAETNANKRWMVVTLFDKMTYNELNSEKAKH